MTSPSPALPKPIFLVPFSPSRHPSASNSGSPPESAISTLSLPVPIRPVRPSRPISHSIPPGPLSPSPSDTLPANLDPSPNLIRPTFTPPHRPFASARISIAPLTTLDRPSSPSGSRSRFGSLADSLPRSVHDLKSLGSVTARPPLALRSVVSGISGVSGVRTVRPGVGLVRGGDEGDTTIRAVSMDRHAGEFQKILNRLKEQDGDCNGCAGCNDCAGCAGCDGCDPPKDPNARHIVPVRMERIGMREGEGRITRRGSEQEGVQQVRIRKVDEIEVEWCWFCHDEYPRGRMRLTALVQDGDQWVCGGCLAGRGIGVGDDAEDADGEGGKRDWGCGERSLGGEGGEVDVRL